MTSKRNRWLLGILFATVLFGYQQSKKSETKEAPLNVVLITLDDMGYGATGVEGSTVPGIRPYIDKLASEGITFTRGFVMSPICGLIYTLQVLRNLKENYVCCMNAILCRL